MCISRSFKCRSISEANAPFFIVVLIKRTNRTNEHGSEACQKKYNVSIRRHISRSKNKSLALVRAKKATDFTEICTATRRSVAFITLS